MDSGFLYIDKPEGVTSHDVIHKLRFMIAPEAKTSKERLRLAKVGHSGTLDPFATGLLICAVGKDATRQLGDWLKKDKEYEATIQLGATSNTGDLEGEIVESEVKEIPTVEEVKSALEKFTGEIEQMPPQFSALKVNGKKAYELAREGKKVELKSRMITIYSLELISYNYPELKIRTKVSSGTYIRVLGEDIGKYLGVGGYLTQLRRTEIDTVSVKSSVKLSELNEGNWSTYLK